jgi:hypothetical protein
VELIGIGKELLKPATKRKDGKMGLQKLKSFCTTKEMVSKLKRPPTE